MLDYEFRLKIPQFALGIWGAFMVLTGVFIGATYWPQGKLAIGPKTSEKIMTVAASAARPRQKLIWFTANPIDGTAGDLWILKKRKKRKRVAPTLAGLTKALGGLGNGIGEGKVVVGVTSPQEVKPFEVNKKNLKLYVKQFLPWLKKCPKKWSKANILEGEFSLRMFIGKTANVVFKGVGASSVIKEVNTCLEKRVLSIDFPPQAYGMDIDFSFFY